MNEDMRELIAADMGVEGYECPVCLDWITDDDNECSCSNWTEEEFREFFKPDCINYENCVAYIEGCTKCEKRCIGNCSACFNNNCNKHPQKKNEEES